MSDTPDPSDPESPRREFRFKPTEFERTNQPLGETDNAAPINVQEIFRQANARPPAPKKAPASGDNEVHAILRANLDRANQEGVNDVDLTPMRSSRRKRDFWFLLIAGNLLFAAVVLLSRNFIVLVCGGAGMIAFSLCITWIMWHVMDDY